MSTGPQYAQVARHLIDEIATGRAAIGTLLPTEEKLCQQFGVSRITIRAALKELELRGMVQRQAGVGTRVAAKGREERYVHIHDSVDDVLRFSSDMHFTVLSQQDLVIQAADASRLKLPEGAAFSMVRALRQRRGELPVALGEHYIPACYRAILPRVSTLTGSLGSAIEQQFGVEIGEINQSFEAERVRPADRAVLQVGRGALGLLSTRHYHTTSGSLLLLSRSLFINSRYVYQATLRRDANRRLK